MITRRGIIAQKRNAPVAVAITMSESGDSNQASACLLLSSFTRYVAEEDFPVVVNSVIYTDINLTTTFNGAGQFYKQGVGTITVNASGLVTGAQICI